MCVVQLLPIYFYSPSKIFAPYVTGPHMVHSHTVHLPFGALLIPCTMCGTGCLTPSLAALAAQVRDRHAVPMARVGAPAVREGL